MNKGRGVPFSVAGVVASTCRADLLLFAGETDVLEEGAGVGVKTRVSRVGGPELCV